MYLIDMTMNKEGEFRQNFTFCHLLLNRNIHRDISR